MDDTLLKIVQITAFNVQMVRGATNTSMARSFITKMVLKYGSLLLIDFEKHTPLCFRANVLFIFGGKYKICN